MSGASDLTRASNLEGTAPGRGCVRRSELARFEASTERMMEARRWRTFSRGKAPTAVLLLAGHQDRDLLRPTLNLLANQGSVVYVDFREEGIPDEPSSELQGWIGECLREDDRSVLVATREGLCAPWARTHLDLAERMLGLQNVAILPVDDFGQIRQHELLSLYPTILRGPTDWRVASPDGRLGPSLRSWLFN